MNERIDHILVCCPEAWISYTRDIIKKYIGKNEKISVVKGGETRNDTILNGCKYIEEKFGLNDEDIILTHDAVRPFLNQRIINDNIDMTFKYGAVDTVVEAFDTRSRYFHFEFFRLDEDKPGLGKKGDLLGLEVNMRTPGGFTPDMMNFGSDVDMYRIYADMIAYGKPQSPINDKKYYVAFASRRDEHVYKTTIDDVKARYADKIVLSGRNAPAIAVAMGDDFVIARFEDFAEIAEFLDMMNEDEMLKLLASDGMLVKRPLLILKDKVIIGFKQEEYLKMANN